MSGDMVGDATLRIAKAGPGVTLQDNGRWGYLRYGVTPAGPMDPLAFATSHWLAGNARDGTGATTMGGTAVEVSLGGVDLVAEGGAIGLGYAGGHFALALDDEPLPSHGFVTLAPGARLSVRAGPSGATSPRPARSRSSRSWDRAPPTRAPASAGSMGARSRPGTSCRFARGTAARSSRPPPPPGWSVPPSWSG